MIASNFSGDGVYYGAGILGKAVARWKKGGVAGALSETKRLGVKAASAVVTGGSSLIPEAASWLKPSAGAAAPSAGASAFPKLDFKNPMVIAGLAGGAVLLLILLKK